MQEQHLLLASLMRRLFIQLAAIENKDAQAFSRYSLTLANVMSWTEDYADMLAFCLYSVDILTERILRCQLGEFGYSARTTARLARLMMLTEVRADDLTKVKQWLAMNDSSLHKPS